MARIVVGAYMVRYPLGGMLSSQLQWILGLRLLGHDVWVVEKSGWRDACFDPERRVSSDDWSYGFQAVSGLLQRHGISDRLAFVDAEGEYHGLSRRDVQTALGAADLFLDIGAHGFWFEEASAAAAQVLIDGEPGRRQMSMELKALAGEESPSYDHYFTHGLNVGTPASDIPTAGCRWRHVLPPIALGQVTVLPPEKSARVTTVMNWRAHDEIEYRGRSYGQKDVEFEKFFSLPRRVTVPLEVAVAGEAPKRRLVDEGWGVRDAHDVTASFDAYWSYIAGSLAEFSPAKNVFVETNSGWFSERSAAYLASGRPAIVQDTGFSAHLPCGEGLFAVRNLDEAAAAIGEIASDYEHHSRVAREIAAEWFDARIVVGQMLEEVGVG